MDAEISFGEFQHAKPEQGVAPDRNPHFAVSWVGEPSDPWPIFVDLDVMRELEAHAVENINVELGGVLLGQQLIDADGRPFVVVQDSLRAEHYEATRGSFKFTHQTWEAITRQREQFPDKFAIVGWYHTHPGWGVFLSDMDLFICDHFFNRSLDVALVIDPVRDDRGWFSWAEDGRGAKKRRTASFGLFAHRHRTEELECVAEYYNEREPMSADPRLRMTKSNSATPTVQIAERALPTSVLVGVAAVILGQLMLMTAVLWRGSNASGEPSANAAAMQLDLLVRERQADARAQSYRELLTALAEKTPDSAGVVDRLTESQEQVKALQRNLEGQNALTQQLKEQNKLSTEQLARLSVDQQKTTSQLAERDSLIKELQAKVVAAQGSLTTGTSGLTWRSPIIWGVLSALIAAIAGWVGGFFWGRRQWMLDSAEMMPEEAEPGPLRDDSKIKLA